MTTICLNMIVREESSVIRRCLDSVKGIIDYWVIVDTGSTDGTQAIIRDCLKNIPGELLERPWVDFAHNRNEALDAARNKSTYILFIDADEKLVLLDPFISLEKDAYCIRMVGKSVEFHRDFLIKNCPDWKWKGVLHEALVNPSAYTSGIIPGAYIEYNLVPGYRCRDLQNPFKEIQILKKALAEDPSDSRSVFYLAQTYGKAQNLPLAFEYYKKRVEMDRQDDSLAEREEVFWSLYSIGCLHRDLGRPFEATVSSFYRAFRFNPNRAEPLYRLAEYFHENKKSFLGYLAAQFALCLPTPEWTIRIQRWIYDYALVLKFAECAHAIGKKEEARIAFEHLLVQSNTPEEIKKSIYEDYLSQYDREK